MVVATAFAVDVLALLVSVDQSFLSVGTTHDPVVEVSSFFTRLNVLCGKGRHVGGQLLGNGLEIWW